MALVKRDYDANETDRKEFGTVIKELEARQKVFKKLAQTPEEPGWTSEDRKMAQLLANETSKGINTIMNNVGTLTKSSLTADQTFASLESKLAKDFSNAFSSAFGK